MEIQKQEKEKEILKSEKIDDALKDKENVNNKDEKIVLDINEEKKKVLDKDADKVKVIEKVKEKDMDNATPLIENVAPKNDRDVLKRTVSAPPSVTEVNALCTCCCVDIFLHVHAMISNQYSSCCVVVDILTITI